MIFSDVQLADVSRHFGRRRAVSHVSLAARSGDIIGLLGPNGAGKSTIIGMLATLVTPTSGTITYGGRTARAIGGALRASIGLLAHELLLYPDLTARQNLALFAGLYGLGADGVVDDALSKAGLSERADDVVSAFSRGMRQRLAVERALLHGPRLVLLDEPFTGLDDESAGLLGARLRMLRGQGAIVLMATHDFESADGLVDRAICLKDGRARELPPDAAALRDRYRRAMAE